MTKIFRYELKKLIVNRFFAILLVVALWYGYLMLKGEILLGVSNTAPFSPWSFGLYVSSLFPLLSAALLFFIASLSSKQEKLTQVLTSASPTPLGIYRFVRCSAIFVGVLLLTVVCLLLGILFLGSLFGFENLPCREWIFPTLLVLVPSLTFVAGLGMLAGIWKGWAVYALIGVVFAVGYLPLPDWTALNPAAFFVDYPKILDVLDPGFSVPISMLVGRMVYFFLGLLLMAVGLKIRSVGKGRKN
jgi:hypothetical protein